MTISIAIVVAIFNVILCQYTQYAHGYEVIIFIEREENRELGKECVCVM